MTDAQHAEYLMWDRIGIAALVLLWVLLAAAIVGGVVVAVRQQTDTDAMRRFERRQAALGRAHENVTGSGMVPAAGAHQRRGVHRRSTPAD